MQKTLTYEEAYDFARFDSRMNSKKKVATKTKTKEEASAKTKPIISGFACLSWVVCMVLLVSIVYSYMMLNEAADRAARLDRELTAIREENQMLEIKKDQKYGSRQMQEIAVNELGMQKIQKSQITYVSTKTSDYTEVAQSKSMRSGGSNFFSGIARGFNIFVEYIN